MSSQRTSLPSIGKISLVSLAGSAIEWYDLFIYGTAAALVFAKLFFPFNPLVARSPGGLGHG